MPKSTTSQTGIETLARLQFKYIEILEEHSAEIRKDPLEGERAFTRFKEGPGVASSGQAWEPATDEAREKYNAFLDEIIFTTATSIDERTRVIAAAQTRLVLISSHELPKLSYKGRLAVTKRLAELLKEYYHSLTTTKPELHTVAYFTRSPTLPPLTRPAFTDKIQITETQRRSFRTNPMSLAGKLFLRPIHSEESDSEGEQECYKIIRVVGEEGAIVYHVQFEECKDTVPVKEEELDEMLRTSFLLY